MPRYTAEGFLSLPFEEIRIGIANPSADKALNDRVTDTFCTTLALYPGDRYSEDQAAFAISRTRRNPDVADITCE